MKKLISILLVLIVLVNVIGFGFLNVKSSAAFVVDDAIYVTVGGIIIYHILYIRFKSRSFLYNSIAKSSTQ